MGARRRSGLPSNGDSAETAPLWEALDGLEPNAGLARAEPNELAAIRALRPDGPRDLDWRPGDRELVDRLHGAWTGRAVGCALGKPVETPWYGMAVEGGRTAGRARIRGLLDARRLPRTCPCARSRADLNRRAEEPGRDQSAPARAPGEAMMAAADPVVAQAAEKGAEAVEAASAEAAGAEAEAVEAADRPTCSKSKIRCHSLGRTG
jgi:hypothetical protein